MNEQQLQPAIATQSQQGDVANFLEEPLNPSQSAKPNEDVDMGQNIEQQKINDFTEDKPEEEQEESKMELDQTPQNTNSNNTNTGNTYNTFNIYAGTNQQPVPPQVTSKIGNKRPIKDIGQVEQPPQKERKIEEPETKTEAPQQQVPPPSNMEVDIPEKSHMVEKVLKNPKTIPEVFQAARESVPNDDSETKKIRVGLNTAMLPFNEQMEYNANNVNFSPKYQGDTIADIKDQVPTSGTVTAHFPSNLENYLGGDDSSPDRNLVSLL